MQTACYWQLFVFRSFYGSSEPGTPHHNDSIPSNPWRPPVTILPPGAVFGPPILLYHRISMYRHSRRGFLKRTLGAYWTGAALLDQSMFRATHARAQATAGLPTLFDIEKVADGVYA